MDIVYQFIRATIIINVKTEERMNPLTPKSDQYLISPYNITTELLMMVMRIKDMISN